MTSAAATASAPARLGPDLGRERRGRLGPAADDVDVLDRQHGAERGHVGAGLRAGAEDHQPPGAGIGEVARGERGDGRGADVREPDAVQDRHRRERLAVEQRVDALDPRQPALGVARRHRRELDPDRAGRGRGHDQQLAAAGGHARPRRVRLRVEAAAQRRLERVDGVAGRQEPRDGRGVEERRRGHRSTKPSPQRVPRVEDEAVLAGPEGAALDLGHDGVAALGAHALDDPAAERGPDDRVVRQHVAVAEPAGGGEQRGPRGRARAARRAVDLAVREHGHVALVRAVVAVRQLVVEDRPVDAREPLVARVAGGLGPLERPLDRPAERDQLVVMRRRRPTARPPAAGSEA